MITGVHNTELTAEILKGKTPAICSNKLGKVRMHEILKRVHVTIFALKKQ